MKKKKRSIDRATLKKLVNPNKLKILEVIKNNKEINQLKIKQQLNVSYSEVVRHIQDLEKKKLIKTRKVKKKKGSPRFISLR